MLSLRSLAFILCSAIRRARALSCAALHCFPDITIGRKRRKNNATKMPTAAPMCSLLTNSIHRIRLPKQSMLGTQRTPFETVRLRARVPKVAGRPRHADYVPPDGASATRGMALTAARLCNSPFLSKNSFVRDLVNAMRVCTPGYVIDSLVVTYFRSTPRRLEWRACLRSSRRACRWLVWWCGWTGGR